MRGLSVKALLGLSLLFGLFCGMALSQSKQLIDYRL